MLRISYKNSSDTEYNEKVKPGRIHPKNVLPLDLTDTWNNVIRKIQTTYWDGYYVEFAVNNDELNDVSLIQVSDNVIIRDLEQNIQITVDKTSPEDFIYNEPEQIGIGNSWKISFTFKNNRRLSNKGISVNQTNTLICQYDDGVSTDTKTFYTDFEVLDNTPDTEQGSSNNQSGINVLGRAISKRTKRAVFYLTIADANNLKDYFEKSQVITLNGTSIIQNDIAISEDFGEGLKKVQIEGLITSTVSYPSSV
jgi:hypothetical protein